GRGAARPGEVPEPLAEVAEPAASQTAALKLERTLVEERTAAADRVPAEPATVVSASSSPVAPPPAPEPDAPAELVPALRRELENRAAAEAALRGRLVQAEASLGARLLIERRTSEVGGR